jgi:hypothetical protein
MFAIGNERDNPECAPECAVEQVVNAALDDTLREVKALLIAVSLAALASAFDDKRQGRLGPAG